MNESGDGDPYEFKLANANNFLTDSGDHESGFHNSFFEQNYGQNIFNKSNFTSPKKRKKDDDGFVTPATPDIPKSSVKYPGPDGQADVVKHNHDFESDQKQDTENKAVDENVEDTTKTEDIYSDIPSQVISKASVPEMTFSSSEEEQNNDKNVVQVMKEMIEKSSEAHLQWAEAFGKSENFEILCPDKLDKLIAQARELEENLLQQKECLKRRLSIITHTLQCSPE